MKTATTAPQTPCPPIKPCAALGLLVGTVGDALVPALLLLDVWLADEADAEAEAEEEEERAFVEADEVDEADDAEEADVAEADDDAEEADEAEEEEEEEDLEEEDEEEAVEVAEADSELEVMDTTVFLDSTTNGGV